MSRFHVIVTAVATSFFTIMGLIATMVGFSWTAEAAPPLAQVNTAVTTYVSISAVNFEPVNSQARYNKNLQTQLLSLVAPAAITTNNLFVAPLNLPDQSQMTGVTVFGRDVDAQGEIRVRVKRCSHGQPQCTVISETTSTNPYAAGQFETSRVAMINETVDNFIFSYFLEAEITALDDSGLRSVRVDMIDPRYTGEVADAAAETWSLSGGVTSFIIPNIQPTQVRVCTDDLSHLSNPTHRPRLIVDGRVTPLESEECVTVTGRDIEVRRNLNTGPSSGTFQILR